MFQFKQFAVADDRCSMKVGTDGVLLGAWAEVGEAQFLLDIGTGSGLIALMCAQRSYAKITAIEIDQPAALQARENIASSPFAPRIEVITADIRQFETAEPFDTIVSNPPYFIDSLRPPNAQRSQARHTHELSFPVLIEKSSQLLRFGGTLQLILPYDTTPYIISVCAEYQLHLTNHTAVITKKGKAPRRSLLRFQKNDLYRADILPKEETLILYDENNHRTPDFQRLTTDFYLR